jgi:hypothetical protein
MQGSQSGRSEMAMFPRRRPKPDPDHNTPLGPDEGTDRKDRRLDKKKEKTKGRTARAGVLKWFFFSVLAVIALILVVKFLIF